MKKSISSLTLIQITKQGPDCGSDICQRENLTQYALVQSVRELRQMSVALMMHTLDTRLTIFRSLMDVERRDE